MPTLVSLHKPTKFKIDSIMSTIHLTRSSPAPMISSLLHSCLGLATYWRMCICCITYLLSYGTKDVKSLSAASHCWISVQNLLQTCPLHLYLNVWVLLELDKIILEMYLGLHSAEQRSRETEEACHCCRDGLKTDEQNPLGRGNSDELHEISVEGKMGFMNTSYTIHHHTSLQFSTFHSCLGMYPAVWNRHTSFLN